MLSGVHNCAEGTIDANSHRISTIFNAAGWKRAVVDANGNRTTSSFDDAGQVVLKFNPIFQRTTLAWDADGRLTLRIDPRGEQTIYAYDDAGRRTRQKYPDGTRATFSYNKMGSPVLTEDWTGATSRDYDPRELLVEIINPDDRTLTHRYDGARQRRVLIDPDNGRTTFSYDPAGRMDQVRNPYAELTITTYDDAGRQVYVMHGNDTTTSFKWDDSDRNTAIVHRTSGGSLFQALTYTYDKADNRRTLLEDTGDSVAWGYDRTYQLTSEHRTGAPAWRHTFTYDPAGNRLTLDTGLDFTLSSYDAANRLVYTQDTTGRTTYSYDAAGNEQRIEKPDGDLTTYTWDHENQMRTAELPDSEFATYTWNAENQRVAKETDSGSIKFLWDGKNLVQEYDELDLTHVHYTLQPQPNPQPYGDLLSQRRDGESAFFHFDALGSTRALTDSGEVVTDQYTFEAFGKPVSPSGSTENNFQWVGEKGYYADAETGLQHIQVRGYRPETGRFTSEDPLLSPGNTAESAEVDTNAYRYSGNNASNSIDPSGLQDFAPPLRPLSCIECHRLSNIPFDQWTQDEFSRASLYVGEEIDFWGHEPTPLEEAMSAFISTFAGGLFNIGGTIVFGLADLVGAVYDVGAIGGEFLIREGALTSDWIGLTTNSASTIPRYESVSSLGTFGAPGTEFQTGAERARDLIYVASTAKYFVDAKKYHDDPSQKNADEWQGSASAFVPFLGVRSASRGIPLSQAVRILRAEGYTRVQRASMLRNFGPDVAIEAGNASRIPIRDSALSAESVFGTDDPAVTIKRSQWSEGTSDVAEGLMEKVAERGWQIDIVEEGHPAYARMFGDLTSGEYVGLREMRLLRRPGQNIKKITVLEEFLHQTQQRTPNFDNLHPYPRFEIHVKDFMIRHKKMLGLSEVDVAALRTMIDELILRARHDIHRRPLSYPPYQR